MKFKYFLPLLFLGSSSFLFAQAPDNWFNLDSSKDNVPGVSTEQMYRDLLKDRQSETVIVAVIDSGIDADHEDLVDVMWVNEDEIAGNGIDDDKNGYVDDIHGWNFIGGKNGTNINDESLEITRLVAKYNKLYANANPDKMSKKEKKKYDAYLAMKKEVEDKRMEAATQYVGIEAMVDVYSKLKKHYGKTPSNEELSSIDTDDADLKEMAMKVSSQLERSGSTFEEMMENLEGGLNYFKSQSEFYYNTDFDPRAKLVGDNYSDPYEKNYGNNDVEGPDAFHGTHVAGIIAAARDNDEGIKGVADNVRIMSVRAVPNGDERDKDVANAIRYAVDNGATIINMSFGKSYVWNKQIVDEAVKYAMKKDVLLIHAAGNDGNNTNTLDNFPNDKFGKKGLFGPKYAKNWIEVGALTYKGGEDAPAGFSNYGNESVDVFAPGYQIYSTVPGGGYGNASGTSMAAPVTAGVAAVLRSYFPELTAKQVKEILETSVVAQNQKVKRPGDKEMVPFSELCVTGGIINSYKAVEKAKQTKGKKKAKKKTTGKVVVP